MEHYFLEYCTMCGNPIYSDDLFEENKYMCKTCGAIINYKNNKEEDPKNDDNK